MGPTIALDWLDTRDIRAVVTSAERVLQGAPSTLTLAMALHFPAPEDDDVERLTRVVSALIAGSDDVAGAELAPLAGVTHEQRPAPRLPELARASWPAGIGSRTKSPSKQLLADVMARDAFVCAYCGRKTIILGVLRLLSLRFPLEFPAHPNWKKSEVHAAYWDISTTVDHLQPVSRGGAWNEMENLVTACARCQYQKGNLPLDVLGWQSSPGTWCKSSAPRSLGRTMAAQAAWSWAVSSLISVSMSGPDPVSTRDIDSADR
jgi:5-methylcytosine-specific restriction endonuclease McrA